MCSKCDVKKLLCILSDIDQNVEWKQKYSFQIAERISVFTHLL